MSLERKTKAALFLELAKPDAEGFSRRVSVSEFVGEYAVLQFGNGGSWVRDDGGLGKKYNIRRIKRKGAIAAVELHGFKKNPINKAVPSDIVRKVREGRCAVLATGKVEVDHKDGRRDDPRLQDPSRVTLEDFQPLSKAANNAKRQHCKNCRETNRRFDATSLGYAVAQWKGNGEYRGSCVGCFWHDPRRFNQEVSARAVRAD